MATVRFLGNNTRIALLSAVDMDIHLPPPLSVSLENRSLGATKQYVGGVRRGVTLPGKSQVVRVDFPRPSWQHATTLSNWVGKAIIYRDIIGRLFYGILTQTSETLDPKTPKELQQSGRFSITIDTTTDTPETLL